MTTTKVARDVEAKERSEGTQKKGNESNLPASRPAGHVKPSSAPIESDKETFNHTQSPE